MKYAALKNKITLNPIERSVLIDCIVTSFNTNRKDLIESSFLDEDLSIISDNTIVILHGMIKQLQQFLKLSTKTYNYVTIITHSNIANYLGFCKHWCVLLGKRYGFVIYKRPEHNQSLINSLLLIIIDMIENNISFELQLKAHYN
jgi:hypothetical protein